MAEAERRTYRGNCHCGSFVYETQLPEIKSVFGCNCSICVKKGYLWIFPGKDNFNIVKGDEDALATYSFGSKRLTHKFCPKCATPLMSSAVDGSPEMQIALNAHAIQGLNTWTLERTPFEGAALGDPYQSPAHKGPLPTEQIEGGQTYTGSCHCGAVTVAIVSKPIDEAYKGALECNCSNCERNGYIWVYPKQEHVVLSGDEANIGRYSFGSGTVSKTFCKTCGVNMTGAVNKLSEEEVAALPAVSRQAFDYHTAIHPVNTRVLHGVDVAKLKTIRFEGATKIPRPYENP